MSSVESPDRKRLCFVAVFLSLFFCLLVVRFYQIQIVEGDKWASAALAQHQYVATEPCMRGSFYSNTSVKQGHPGEEQPFVVDVPKFHLFIDPDSIPETAKSKMALEFSKRFGIDKKGEFFKKSRSRKIASWLDRDDRIKIENWWNQFCRQEKIVKNAIYFTAEFKRSYPFGPLLGAVLHTVQDDQSHPTGGLEMSLNSYLTGKEGKRLIVRSPRHPLGTGKVLVAPENGADVYLTINHYLQAIAESELAKGVKTANALGGWAMMMDPFTGEVLALAQTPEFDPTRYTDYFNDLSLIDNTKVKAVTDCFEPGSIFKPITVAICMLANEELAKSGKKPIFTPEEKIPCSNGWFPGRSRPLKDGRHHSFLNMDLAMQKSSNIYMARIIQRLVETMGDQWYRNALSDVFGFGQKTNIDLPAESSGLLPTPGKLHPNGKLEWSLPTPYSLAIGHNILTNSVQLARAYAIIANGGFAVQPHLIRRIIKNGKIVVDNTSYRATKRVLSPSISKSIIRSMKFVTKPGGTSKRGDVLGYSEAGKSGTSEKIINGQYSKEHNISSFVGIAPANRPRFVLIVTIDEPEKKFIPGVGGQQYGGVCAAPVFREIATKALQYLGVTPDDPHGYSTNDPRRDSKKADWAYEVQELKELYESWNCR
ncbi:MAG: penicillin-binding protein 2 [Chlamydiae bacterium CG10_big_fil_rev_8_21_14_0_10_42_34]|nr:MAG: penicillin-binding protein 2 [Chlamydiae bacterium CG10_big_fil_rev_8_21_14_0_10_42_34]